MSHAAGAPTTTGVQRTSAAPTNITQTQNLVQPEPHTQNREARNDEQQNRGTKRKAPRQFDEPQLKRVCLDKQQAQATALLIHSIRGQDQQAVRELLSSGLVPDVAALTEAARLPHAAILQLLHESLGKPSQPDPILNTLLIAAAQAGAREVLGYLLKNGADVKAVDRYQRTALHHACAGGHEAAAETLEKAGAPFHERDLEGNTPLMLAAANDQREILGRYRGMTTAMKDTNDADHTPLDLAALNGCHGAIEVLLWIDARAQVRNHERLDDLGRDLLKHRALHCGVEPSREFLAWRQTAGEWRQYGLSMFRVESLQAGHAQCTGKSHVLFLTASLLESRLVDSYKLCVQLGVTAHGRPSDFLLARLLSNLPGPQAAEKKILDSTLSQLMKDRLLGILREELEAVRGAAHQELANFQTRLAAALTQAFSNQPNVESTLTEKQAADLKEAGLFGPVVDLLQSLLAQTLEARRALPGHSRNGEDLWPALANALKQWNEQRLASNSLRTAFTGPDGRSADCVNVLLEQWRVVCRVFGLELASAEI